MSHLMIADYGRFNSVPFNDKKCVRFSFVPLGDSSFQRQVKLRIKDYHISLIITGEESSLFAKPVSVYFLKAVEIIRLRFPAKRRIFSMKGCPE